MDNLRAFMDFEWCSELDNPLISYAWVLVDADRKRIVEQEYFCTNVPANKIAAPYYRFAEITRETQEKYGASPEDMTENLKKRLENGIETYLFGGDFDGKMLEKMGILNLCETVYDAQKNYTQLAYDLGYEFTTNGKRAKQLPLVNLKRYLGIPHGDNHDALEDTLIFARFYCNIAADGVHAEDFFGEGYADYRRRSILQNRFANQVYDRIKSRLGRYYSGLPKEYSQIMRAARRGDIFNKCYDEDNNQEALKSYVKELSIYFINKEPRFTDAERKKALAACKDIFK